MTYIPIYSRPPNTFIRYEDRPFNHGNGLTGIYRVALYLDRKGKPCEEVAQVKWDEGVISDFYKKINGYNNDQDY